MASEPPVRRPDVGWKRARKDGGREPPARPGDRVAHYEILAELGRGGMGVVYRARDALLERDVALKCPWLDLTSNPTARERFTREARAAARLSHPHFVPVFEVLEHEGVPWLAMELVEGRSLRALLRERGALGVEEILRCAAGLAHALRAAHGKQILHRDLTPNNVLLTTEGWPFLTDFGLARALAPEEAESSATTESEPLTGHGQIVGTRCYMSPEQVLGRTLDARSDIFSFGAVLYEMCTGQRAFGDSEPGAANEAVLHRDPTDIRLLNREIPSDLALIVGKALAKHPRQRYQDMGALHADIVACRRRIESAESRRASAPSPPWLDRRATWALGAALTVAASVVAWRTSPLRAPSAVFPLGTPRQLTSDPGWESEPVLSPDGSLVAYTSNASGNADVWVLDVGSGGRVQLTADPAADQNPTWRTDGSVVLFDSDRGGQEAIWSVARLGGSAVLVVPDAVQPAVSPDGRWLAFARPNVAGQHRIMVAPVADPSLGRWLTGDADGQRDHSQPAWSPDGRTICYADPRNLWLVNVDAGRPAPLTNESAIDSEPVFSSDGRHVLFSSYREGTLALWRVPAQGGAAERLTAGAGPEGNAKISSDGSRLVYSTFLQNFDIVLLDVVTGHRELVQTLMHESAPALSRDGGALVFTSTRRGGRYDLWLQDLVSGRPRGAPRLLTDLPGNANTPAFSSDGQWVAFKREYEGRREIWTVSVSGGLPERFSEGPSDLHPAFSPDATQLAYVSERSGASHIWVAPVSKGRRMGSPRQIASRDATVGLPVWSPDGRQIAYVGGRPGGQDIWIAPAQVGALPRRVLSSSSLGRLRWQSSTGWLWFAAIVGGEAQLSRVRPDRSEALPALSAGLLAGAWAPGDFDLSLDGRVLAFTREETRGDLWLLDGEGRMY